MPQEVMAVSAQVDRGVRRLADGMPADAVRFAGEICQPEGLRFDAFGAPRTRYVRVSLNRSHCVMRPSEGDAYLKDARDNGDDSAYVVRDVYLSEREFEDLPEHDGF